MRLKPSLVLSLLAMLLLNTGCEVATDVTLQGGNPPVFVLSGSGEVLGFGICRSAESTGQKSPCVWEIKPRESPRDYASKLGKITYGEVPKGYIQVTPPSGATAPALSPGTRYEFSVTTQNAPHAYGSFEIRDGKAVLVGSIRH